MIYTLYIYSESRTEAIRGLYVQVDKPVTRFRNIYLEVALLRVKLKMLIFKKFLEMCVLVISRLGSSTNNQGACF